MRAQISGPLNLFGIVTDLLWLCRTLLLYLFLDPDFLEDLELTINDKVESVDLITFVVHYLVPVESLFHQVFHHVLLRVAGEET